MGYKVFRTELEVSRNSRDVITPTSPTLDTPYTHKRHTHRALMLTQWIELEWWHPANHMPGFS